MDPTREELKRKAAKYRAMARQSTDDEDANRLFRLAAELEEQARDLKPDEQ
jgi:hypothetical protein